MTATTARLLPIGPGKARNAITNALLRAGMTPQAIEGVWYDLTTGQDPRPSDVPETFTFRGIRLTWPRGRHTRVVIKAEIGPLNRALLAAGCYDKDQQLDLEDTCETARGVYQFLLDRKAGKHTGHTYNPEPVREEQMRELVAEATEARRVENEPILVFEAEPLADVTVAEPVWQTDGCPFERDECLAMQDNGEGACDEHEPPTREQRLAAMPKPVEAEVKVEIVPEPAPLPRTDVDALLADLDALSAKLGL